MFVRALCATLLMSTALLTTGCACRRHCCSPCCSPRCNSCSCPCSCGYEPVDAGHFAAPAAAQPGALQMPKIMEGATK